MDEYWTWGRTREKRIPVPCVGRGDVVQQEGGIGTALGTHYSDSVQFRQLVLLVWIWVLGIRKSRKGSLTTFALLG